MSFFLNIYAVVIYRLSSFKGNFLSTYLSLLISYAVDDQLVIFFFVSPHLRFVVVSVHFPLLFLFCTKLVPAVHL